MKQLSPVITVDAIEPCLPFWTERLGFEVTGTVPRGDVLGFAMMSRGGVQIMYQTRDSIADDIPALLDDFGTGKTPLFIEVDAIDPLLPALEGADVVVERRTTFYDMDEIFVRAPCGTVVGFASRVSSTD